MTIVIIGNTGFESISGSIGFLLCLLPTHLYYSIMLKTLLFFGALTASTILVAQSTTAGLPNAPRVSDWQFVQSLQIRTTVYVKSNVTRSRCNVQTVSADSFSCDGGPVFKLAEIESIKRPNRLQRLQELESVWLSE
jgi:hypothetical protein